MATEVFVFWDISYGSDGLRDAADIASSAAEQATKAVAKAGEDEKSRQQEVDYSGWCVLYYS